MLNEFFTLMLTTGKLRQVFTAESFLWGQVKKLSQIEVSEKKFQIR